MTEKPHIALTAASSFTGYWIAEAFLRKGWRVSALYSGSVSDYRGVRKQRVLRLRGRCKQYFGIRAENGSMSKWIIAHSPQIWIHHHHITKDLWAQNYNFSSSIAVGIAPLPALIRSLAESGCAGVVYSGSYLEPKQRGERKVLPYIRSKMMVWECLHRLCGEFDLPVSKIFIPNPVGPLENESRLIPSLVSCARKHSDLKVMNPKTVIDQYPVKDLAQIYLRVASALLQKNTMVVRPSGWVGSVAEWVEKVSRELVSEELNLPRPEIVLRSSRASIKRRRSSRRQKLSNWSHVWSEMALDFAKEFSERKPIPKDSLT